MCGIFGYIGNVIGSLFSKALNNLSPLRFDGYGGIWVGNEIKKFPQLIENKT